MAQIAIFHPDIMFPGGASAVGVHTIEALVEEYDISVYTTTEVNFEELNQFHGTNLSPEKLSVEQLSTNPAHLVSAFQFILRKFGIDSSLGVLRRSICRRDFTRNSYEYDLSISTWNELFHNAPTVQYIHVPEYSTEVYQEYVEGTEGQLHEKYHSLCRLIAGASSGLGTQTMTLANSTWTASLFEKHYGETATVMHPPVDISSFNPADWGEKEDGFVTIGRIQPDKNQLNLIKIVDDLRERGYEMHLHIVGSRGGNEEYCKKVCSASESRDYVNLEGRVSRSRLVSLVEKHKYGLHGKQDEHFGMAVAELAAGGAVPFVPNSGGQKDIVGDSRLTYDGADNAVDTIESVLESPERQLEHHTDVVERSRKFSKERFRSEMRSIVSEALSERE